MPSDPLAWTPDEAAARRIKQAIMDAEVRLRHNINLRHPPHVQEVARAVIAESPLARAVELLREAAEDLAVRYSTTEEHPLVVEMDTFLRDLGMEGK